MKKVILSLTVASFLIACGGGSSKEENSGSNSEDKKETKTEDISSNPDYQKGVALIGKNDCLTCHKIDETLTGPSYREVANKYAGMPDTIITHLAHKIIQGGMGVWGSVYMTPHPGVSQEDAEAMVKYILLLKK